MNKAGIAIAFTLVMTSAVAARNLKPTKPTDGMVRIGVLTDMSGAYSDVAGRGSLIAAQMAIEDSGGSVAGVPVDVISADHQNKPDVAATIARTWYDTKQVDAIFDVMGSPVSLAVMDIAKQKGRIVFANGSGTSRITNEECNSYTVHTSWDSYSQSTSLVNAIVKAGGDSWYFVTLDNAGGKGVEQDSMEAVRAAGGKVVGNVRFPLGNSDFSSFMVQAQASKAKVVAITAAGEDNVRAAKSAREFGLQKSGQTIVGMAFLMPDVHGLGLSSAQGMVLNESFYWDMDERTRAWSKCFFDRMKRMPTSVQAGVYSSVFNYLTAVRAAGTDEADAVMAQLKRMPIDDVFARHGRIREDGRMIYDMYVAEVKKPAESKYPWDYYKIKTVIPAEQAFLPISKSRCSLVKK